jgi:hypothetical protein
MTFRGPSIDLKLERIFARAVNYRMISKLTRRIQSPCPQEAARKTPESTRVRKSAETIRGNHPSGSAFPKRGLLLASSGRVDSGSIQILNRSFGATRVFAATATFGKKPTPSASQLNPLPSQFPYTLRFLFLTSSSSLFHSSSLFFTPRPLCLGVSPLLPLAAPTETDTHQTVDKYP